MNTFFRRAAAILLSLCVLLPAAGLAANHEPYELVADEDRTATPQGIRHYMLICIDQWNVQPRDLKEKMGYHTDGLMLVTVDEISDRVMITSFIRDMLIVRPDGEWGRINNIFYLNGQTEDAVNKLLYTINRHFDLNVEKFIMVDFSSVERIMRRLYMAAIRYPLFMRKTLR